MRIIGLALLGSAGLILIGFLYWRYVWFFRNPPRTCPAGDGVVSPADGTVVYVKELEPNQDVIVIKKGIEAGIKDIVRQDLALPRMLVGIFMSPFDVHYNRAPVSGEVEFIRHYPAKKKNLHMGSMHWRTLAKRLPYYENSFHILENERKVTKINAFYKDLPFSCYIIQIAGGSVQGIESCVKEGETIQKGAIFGMIRIGSQVDLVMPRIEGLKLKARPGDKVRAGETIILEPAKKQEKKTSNDDPSNEAFC
jgi:phosphatidylserine decarboxylase